MTTNIFWQIVTTIHDATSLRCYLLLLCRAKRHDVQFVEALTVRAVASVLLKEAENFPLVAKPVTANDVIASRSLRVALVNVAAGLVNLVEGLTLGEPLSSVVVTVTDDSQGKSLCELTSCSTRVELVRLVRVAVVLDAANANLSIRQGPKGHTAYANLVVLSEHVQETTVVLLGKDFIEKLDREEAVVTFDHSVAVFCRHLVVGVRSRRTLTVDDDLSSRAHPTGLHLF
jgi:hypothetical protein